jgi:CDGSH-type Zn-finger protein/uncharacterized Fe-S cluster protein YjdI
MSKKIREYVGADITVRYDAKKCIHFAECVKRLPKVFDPRAKPWVSPDRGEAAQVAEAVTSCPTGALTFERLDGGDEEPMPSSNTAVVTRDGPVLITGDIRVHLDGLDEPMTEKRIALCRCWASENKPFCDGRHSKAGFVDPGVIPSRPSQPGDNTGPLNVRLGPNGPVLFEGPLDVLSDDRNEKVTGQKGALCRCGQSATKPFCDGSHRTAGFEA